MEPNFSITVPDGISEAGESTMHVYVQGDDIDGPTLVIARVARIGTQIPDVGRARYVHMGTPVDTVVGGVPGRYADFEIEALRCDPVTIFDTPGARRFGLSGPTMGRITELEVDGVFALLVSVADTPAYDAWAPIADAMVQSMSFP
jgi:hypothetical protein